ncbi:hypothetical protein BOTBODRAFT_188568 [Botryobasidium botryosum FD-172 SS1]|uniref:F-box domain-containing protein n=1 Tax=Botryobasidium botryosum (strain FD-172 SS1) TaxID=930990 RepID=A0A067MCK4_BOTB1|nr:hypothetical protein BOTBODRAFT_188568 [Botryobasidium botryosum FD-172 SS1]
MATSPDQVEACIQRLSDDVLLELFSPAYVEDARDSIFQIAHVCRRWRQLIHGNPSFWSTIWFSPVCSKDPTRAAYWLERAGTYPVSVKAVFPSADDGESDDQEIGGLEESGELRGHSASEGSRAVREHCISEFANVLRHCTDRWHRLEIEHTNYSDLSTFFQRFEGSATPQLKHLTISVGFDGARIRPELFVPFEHSAGGSVSVTLTECCIPTFSLSFGLAVTSLQLEWKVGTVTTQEFRNLLQSCPNLETLILKMELGSMRDSVPPCSAPHLRLTTLSITGCIPIHNVLGLIQFPSLQNLQLRLFFWCEAIALSIERVMKSSHSLSRISISSRTSYHPYMHTTPWPNPPTITIFPSIEVLDIMPEAHPIIPLLLRAICPNLKRIVFRSPCMDVRVVQQLVASAPNLTTLVFGKRVAPRWDPISKPALTYLEFSGGKNIFDTLHAPNLVVLSMDDYGHYQSPWQIVTLRTMLQKHSPPLRALSLKNSSVFNNTLIPVLKLMPQLEVLVFDECSSITDNLLHDLATPVPESDGGPATGTWLLPRLREVRIFNATCITPYGVLAFLSARSVPPHSESATPTNTPHSTPPLFASVEGAVLFSFEGLNDEGIREEIRSFGFTVLVKEVHRDAIKAWKRRALLKEVADPDEWAYEQAAWL